MISPHSEADSHGTMSRRSALHLATGALLGAAIGSAPAGAAVPNAAGGSPKKGFPIGTSKESYKQMLTELRVAWYYNWGPSAPTPQARARSLCR